MTSFEKFEKDQGIVRKIFGDELFYRLSLHTIYHLQKNVTPKDLNVIVDDISESFKAEMNNNESYIDLIKAIKGK